MVTIDGKGKSIQDLSYGYDEVGNIVKINDGVNTANQQFFYDSLNRLTQAEGKYGLKTFKYDEIGNILLKDDLMFFYGENGAGPHAVTSLSDGTKFNYDANGNMITMHRPGEGWEYVFDSENRLIKIRKDGALVDEIVHIIYK